MKEIGTIEGVVKEMGSIEGGAEGLTDDRVPSDLDSPTLPPTQDDDLWLEATIEETESEWWL